MAQYNKGKVIVTDASQFVDAAWEILLPTVTAEFVQFSPLHFTPSGARAVIYTHQLTNGEVTFGLDPGSADPAKNDLVEGPNKIVIVTATATDNGTGSNTLEDTAAGFVDDEHNMRWVILRPGLVDEEWRRITDVIAANDELVVHANWTVEPSSGDVYVIYENQKGNFKTFKAGTPQDFVAAGVKIAHEFTATPEPPWYTIATVTARRLTLNANFVLNTNVEGRGVGFAVHRDFTPGSNLALIDAGDTQFPSLLRRNAIIMDASLSRMYGGKQTAGFFWTRPHVGQFSHPLLHQTQKFNVTVDGPGSGNNSIVDAGPSYADDELNGMYLVTGSDLTGETIDTTKAEVHLITDTIAASNEIVIAEDFRNLAYAQTAGTRYTVLIPFAGSSGRFMESTSDWIEDAPNIWRYAGLVKQRFRWHFSIDIKITISPGTNVYVGLLRWGVDDDKEWLYAEPDPDETEAMSGSGEFDVWPGNLIVPLIYSDTDLIIVNVVMTQYMKVILYAI